MKTKLHYEVKLHGLPKEAKQYEEFCSNDNFFVFVFALWQVRKVMRKVPGVFCSVHIRRVAQ